MGNSSSFLPDISQQRLVDNQFDSQPQLSSVAEETVKSGVKSGSMVDSDTQRGSTEDLFYKRVMNQRISQVATIEN